MSETRGTSTDHTPHWHTFAACTADPDAMFPNSGDREGIRDAKAVCATCPVRLVCLDDAMAEEGGKTKENRHGIRGGLTSSQRYSRYHRLRMQKGKQAAA